MTTASRFEQLANEWAEHCQTVSDSSSTAVYATHPVVQKLIDLGPDVVPLIMARYPTDFSCPWEYVLAPVTGVRMNDNPDVQNGMEMYRRRLEWWEANRHRYEDTDLIRL